MVAAALPELAAAANQASARAAAAAAAAAAEHENEADGHHTLLRCGAEREQCASDTEMGFGSQYGFVGRGCGCLWWWRKKA